MDARSDLYGGTDPRELPLYGQREAAHYVGVPVSTLRRWLGEGGPALIMLPRDDQGRLSFNNLVEAYVLRAIRQTSDVGLKELHRALKYAERDLNVRRLLLSPDLAWSGDLYLQKLSDLVNLSKSGQLAMREIVGRYLQRIEWDEATRLPRRLFPPVAADPTRRSVVIDPRVAFGQPTMAGTGVGTAIVVQRIDAGEPPEDVAADYGVTVEAITDALVYEKKAA